MRLPCLGTHTWLIRLELAVQFRFFQYNKQHKLNDTRPKLIAFNYGKIQRTRINQIADSIAVKYCFSLFLFRHGGVSANRIELRRRTSILPVEHIENKPKVTQKITVKSFCESNVGTLTMNATPLIQLFIPSKKKDCLPWALNIGLTKKRFEMVVSIRTRANV